MKRNKQQEDLNLDNSNACDTGIADNSNIGQRCIVIAYKTRNRPDGSRVISEFEEFSAKKKLQWNVEKAEIPKNSCKKVLALAERVDALIYVHGGIAANDALSHGDAEKLEQILLEKDCIFVNLRMSDPPIPFGFPRGVSSIKCNRKSHESVINSLCVDIDDQFKGKVTPTQPVWNAITQLIEDRPLYELKSSTLPLLKLLRTDPCLLHTAIYLFDWISYVSINNEKEVWYPTIEHSGIVLDYFVRLCGPLDSSSDANRLFREDCFPIRSRNDCFAALFGVLLHNQSLMRVVSRAPYGQYSDNTKTFLARTHGLAREICRCVPKEPLRHILGAFYIGIEMFKDSFFWSVGTQDDQKTYEYHLEIERDFSKDNHKAISVALRICDLLDIGHRYIPDLIRDLFSGAQYDEGLKCYFKKTFADDKNFLFTASPSLNERVLELSWPAYGREDHLEFLGVIKKVIERILNKTLKALKSEINHQNFAVSLHSNETTKISDPKQMQHIIWSFFPLNIEYTPSDSHAARIAIQILPILVDYILDADETPRGSYEFTKRHVNILLDKVGKLRRNSHDLPKIVDIVREAIRNQPPTAYSGIIKTTLKQHMPQLSDRNRPIRRERSMRTIETHARCFFVYGISQPVSEWLVELYLQEKQPIKIVFLFCQRKLLVPGPAFNEHLEVLHIPEHDAARKLLRLTMSEYNIDNKGTIEIVKDPWDFERLPTHEREKGRSEILFGVRGFLQEEKEQYAIGNYGCDLLAVIGNGLDIPVRIVTSEARFTNGSISYDPEKMQGGFSISYSHVGRPGAEDERIQFDLITHFTTEQNDYNSDRAGEILRKCEERKVSQPKSNPKPRGDTISQSSHRDNYLTHFKIDHRGGHGFGEVIVRGEYRNGQKFRYCLDKEPFNSFFYSMVLARRTGQRCLTRWFVFCNHIGDLRKNIERYGDADLIDDCTEMDEFETRQHLYANPPDEFDWHFVRKSTDSFFNNTIKRHLDGLENDRGIYKESEKLKYGPRLRTIIKTVFKRDKDMKTMCVDLGYTLVGQEIVGVGFADVKNERIK